MRKIKKWLIKRLKWMIRKLGDEAEMKGSLIVKLGASEIVTYRVGYRAIPSNWYVPGYKHLDIYKEQKELIDNPMPPSQEVIDELSMQFLEAVKENMAVEWLPEPNGSGFGYVATLKFVKER